MNSLLPFIIAGLTTGSVYGLAGLGLVLTYKTSNIFNFANGALATISAFLFYTLHVQHGMPWPFAALICLIIGGPVLGIAMEFLGRSLSEKTLPLQVAGTIGILLIVQASVALIYGTSVTRTVAPFLGTHLFHIGGTAVRLDQIVIWAVGLLATVGLFIFFRKARLGLAMRAVVDASDLLDITGTSPRLVRRWAWIIGVTFASASGLLLAPLINLDGTTLTLLVVQGFGAAAIGRFTNLTATYLGGLAIGIVASLSTKWFTSGVLSGLPPALPFIVLFVVLLVAPKAKLATRARVVATSARSRWTAPAGVQIVGALALIVFLIFVPNFAGAHLTDWTLFLAGTITFLSLGLLVRTSGQVSLCQVSFSAIGAAGFSHLAVDHGMPWLVALLLAGLIAVPIGALLAIPAIRLSGLYLALATFGFGILLSYMFYSEGYMFGFNSLGLTEPRPHLSWISLDSDKGFYYVCLVSAILVSGAVVLLVRSRLGRLLRALSDSPRGLATGGTSVQVTRVLVFCISAFLAAIAGALAGSATGVATADSYQPLLSITYFAVIIIVVGGAPWYAVVAGAGLWVIPIFLTNSNINIWLSLVFGLSALLYSVMPDSLHGMPPAIARLVDRLRRAPSTTVVATGVERPRAPVGSVKLDVEQLQVRFGGLVAVQDVSLSVPAGRITGLIGPNGAGKTTTFNACSGLNRPSSGRVVFGDVDISHQGPAIRARSGLGRTFQLMELYDSMTVRQNVELGAEASYAGSNALAHMVATPSQNRQAKLAAEDAIERCGLSDLADRSVGQLSTGQRRLVELARCLAGPYKVLLLDEPSSGLDRNETENFGRILQRAVSDWGIGILLVEHDLALVSEVCDYIYVLDFGRMIFEGPPQEVMSSEIVQTAYLGTGGPAGQLELAEG